MSITPINFAAVSQNQSKGGNISSANSPAWAPKPQSLGSRILSGIGSIAKTVLTPTLPGISSTAVPQTITAAKNGIQQIKQGANTITSGNATPTQGGEAGLSMEAGVGQVVGSPLAPIFSALSTALQGVPGASGVMDKIVNNPVVQKFALSNAGKTATRVATDLSNAGQVAGTILGTDQISKINTPSATPVVETPTVPKLNSVDAATQANNQAGATAVQGANDASKMVYSAKADAATNFSAAPKTIMATDPNLNFDLKSNTLEKLDALKDTKTFSLPDYLRPNSENFGNGSIDISKVGTGESSGIKLNPIQTQDLITRLNDLAFKSNGDLAVNQQTADVINDVKNQAQNTFGHITDEKGNSVWGQAYQNYGQVMDAVKSASKLVNINKTPGEMSDPTEIDRTIKNILSLQDTPQGRANINQFIQEFKNRTGYDLSDPIQAQTKLIDSNVELQKAIKGGYMKQLGDAMKNPSTVGRRLIYLTGSLIGIATVGTAFRKQIGSYFTGQ